MHRILLLIGFVILQTFASECSADLPVEPVSIGYDPQFVFDNHIIDNHWAIKYKRQAVTRVFHQATKYAANPVMAHDAPSYCSVVYDEEASLFRMYYQANIRATTLLPDGTQETLPSSAKGRKFKTFIAYAESKDGVNWTRPDLGLFPWVKQKPNNIVIARAESETTETCGPYLLEVPESARRGYRWLMLYRAKGRDPDDYNGIRIRGSQDGTHWDEKGDTRIAHLHSDHHNTVSYDADREEFVLYCRAKHIYRAFGEEMIDTGASRRVARISSRDLWADWLEHSQPQTILVPDKIDSEIHFNFFYGMPTRHRYGIYWGFLEPFRMNDFIQTELTISRDGFNFERFAGRKPIIPYGEEGSWDDEMIFASPQWLEVGDEWWIYYSGWDGPHGTPERNGAIGLAKIRKEGFVSLHGPQGGGVVCTRSLIWPGGDLVVNAAATDGILRVRISDAKRKPIDGFNYDDCQNFSGNSVSRKIKWGVRSLDELKGQTIRLEFYLQNADLFTFRAVTNH
ncbi:MAG: hypothetical protein HQ518_17820 [Rhodopirellula sp.]|nr:hypothetical protein [Rhodopirellula sp.]